MRRRPNAAAENHQIGRQGEGGAQRPRWRDNGGAMSVQKRFGVDE